MWTAWSQGNALRGHCLAQMFSRHVPDGREVGRVCRAEVGLICLNPVAAVGNIVAVASRESVAPDASHTVCRCAIGGNSLSRREVRRMTATTFCDAISPHRAAAR